MLKRINQDDLRNHNLSVVLSTLTRSHEPMSRAAIAKETGLTKATLSLLGDILIRNEVVRQLKPSADQSFGRPGKPLAFNPGRWAGLGLQINTDGYGYTVLDVNGTTVMSDWKACSPAGTAPADVFDALDAMVLPVEDKLRRLGYTIVGTGLALPGLVVDSGRLLHARNLGWHELDLSQYEVVRRLGAKADNEATLAAIAQIPGYASQWRPSAEPLGPFDSFIYISTDIGIGGAYVRKGQIVPGDHGFAGELGHVCVDMRGPQCRCGRHGCLEMYAGRRAMVEAAGIAGTRNPASAELLPALRTAWRSGDTRAVFAVDNAVTALACVMASAINIIDCDTIVLGGLWSEFGDNLLDSLQRRVQSQIVAREMITARVMFPPVNEHPALYGAAVVGLRNLIEHPVDFISD